MTWTELKHEIYYRDGSLRDMLVLRADRQDWKKWIDYVNENYRVKWYNGKVDRYEDRIDIGIIEEYWNGEHDLSSIASVFIDEIVINAYLADESEIENDICPKEFDSLKDHEKLMKFMTDLARILDKEVILTPENEKETVLIRIEQGGKGYTIVSVNALRGSTPYTNLGIKSPCVHPGIGIS
ncbi:hypothetical protein L3C95_30830 [Chitinophaga filiformis]|uniref:hypothetical protein n=1 Tax=Chitinophaga filiformis TaxID=104663 RepID=UPI001F1CD6E3|nr:hypothetical protein [Chitinophaga filiformis]MCF6407330.1 hypothetical protein [Chitinophaga filiformis]